MNTIKDGRPLTTIFVATLFLFPISIHAQPKPELIIQTGHSSSVWSVAFGPGGDTLVSGSQDGTIKLWDLATGAELRTFAHGSIVNSLILSPDGKTLVSGGVAGSIRQWDLESGKELRSIKGPSAKGFSSLTYSIALSPDRKTLASGSEDKNIRLWDLDSGREIRTISGHSSSVFAVKFSPDGRTLASGSGDTTIKLWDVETGSKKLTLSGHSSSVLSVVFSPDGGTLASADESGAIKLWDLQSGREVQTLSGDSSIVYSIVFSPDGKILASGGEDHTIRLLDVASGKEIRTLRGHSNFVISVVFSPNGKTLASGSVDKTIKLWDVETGTEIRSLTGHSQSITSISLSPDGKTLASLSELRINVWDVENGTELRTLSDDAYLGGNLVFSPDGKTLAAGVQNGTDGTVIKLWDLGSGRVLQTLEGSPLEFSPDGKILASSKAKTIKLWDVKTGKELQTLSGHTEVVYAASFSPNGKILASGSWDETIKLWDVESAKQLETTPVSLSLDHIPDLSFSSDGKSLLSSGDSTIKLFDVASGKLLDSWDYESAYTRLKVLNLFPRFYERVYQDGVSDKLIAHAAENGKIRLFDRATGKELVTLVALDESDWVVATPEGRFDTNKALDQIEGLHWLINNNVEGPLPLDVFMRQYYEPQLLRRVLKDEQFKPLPSIADINRVRPKVSIVEIKREATDSALVNITVAVRNSTEDLSVSTTDPTKKKQFSSGAYDLRLFRGGQLVGYSTSDERLQSTFKTYEKFDDELAAWRRANRVDLVDGEKTFTFSVKLSADSNLKEVEFSAYAFNEDRVKSNTATFRWPIAGAGKTSPSRGKPRAYVIAVGVNANENPAFDLQFAANDARRFQEVLPQRLAATGKYSEVVPITLISDWELQRGQKVATKRDATKANFKAVLDLLAGRPVAEEVKRGIPNGEKLAKTTPDDMVLILFSSHGYADQSGNFYFIPYDTGPGACSVFTETVRQRSISSDELSLWLRDVDAGQMTLIVDACYSTAAIEGSGFKPGPMGSRGLGQLAYDKRMRILTATQADNVAMELPATATGLPINHGLLSYALLEDGLGANKADFKPQDETIFLDEWLEYAVADVPKLFANQPRPLNETQPTSTKRNDRPRLVLLKRQLADSGACGTAPTAGPMRTQEQQPSLFDFTRRKHEVALVRNP